MRKDAATGTDVYAEVVTGSDPETTALVNGYSVFGGMQRLTLDSGKLLERWDYNNRGQVTMLQMHRTPSGGTAASLMKLQPGYGVAAENNGNVMSQSIAVGVNAFTASQSYTYDKQNRLETVVEGTNWKQKFGYDQWGNRWMEEAQTSGIVVPSGTPNGASWYSTGKNQIGAVGLYDAAGNGSPVPGRTYGYDVENRMVSVNGGSAALNETFVYDGQGRRVKRTVDGVSSVYVYDAAGQLAQEYGGVASAVTGRSYLFTDHLGSTRMRVAGDGTVQGWWDYAPFGEEVPGTAGNRSAVGGFAYGGASASVMFTGQVRDRLVDGTASGLDYFGARYFSGAQGRFTSPDEPLFDQNPYDTQSWNLYNYVRNNPLSFSDPTGRACVRNGSGAYEDDSSGGQTCAQVDAENSRPINNQANPRNKVVEGNTVDHSLLMGALIEGIQRAEPGVNLAGQGLSVFGSLVAPLPMALVQCAAGNCSASGIAMAMLPEIGGLYKGGTVLKLAAASGKKGAEIVQKSGGASKAIQEFQALGGAEVVNGGVRVRTLSDGTRAVLYTSSSGSEATIAIQEAGKTVTKFRY